MLNGGLWSYRLQQQGRRSQGSAPACSTPAQITEPASLLASTSLHQIISHSHLSPLTLQRAYVGRAGLLLRRKQQVLVSLMEGINRLHRNGRKDLKENSHSATANMEQKPLGNVYPLTQTCHTSKALQDRRFGQLVHSQSKGWNSEEEAPQCPKGSQEPQNQRATHSLGPPSLQGTPQLPADPHAWLCPRTLTSVYRRAGWIPCTAVTVSGSSFRFHSLRLRSS